MAATKSGTELHVAPLDAIKLALAVLLLGFSIGQFYYLGSHPLIYGGAAHEIPAAIRLLILLAALALAVVSARFTTLGAAGWRYLMTAWNEVQRMIWPDRQQTIQATIAVVILVALLCVFMWVTDLIVQFAMHSLIGL